LAKCLLFFGFLMNILLFFSSFSFIFHFLFIYLFIFLLPLSSIFKFPFFT
jgi:hypothetical protein